MANDSNDTFSALSDVLGGAAKAGASANQVRDALTIALENAKLNREKYAAVVPNQRLGNSTRASFIANAKPSSVQWGGPGSGLKGQIPQFSGGLHDAIGNLDPETKQLAQNTIHDQLLAEMRGAGGGSDTAMPKIGQTSAGDKLLGASALGTGILGALGKSGGGGSIDLTKLFGSIFNKNGGSSDWQGPTNDPSWDYQGPSQDEDPTIDPSTGLPWEDYGPHQQPTPIPDPGLEGI